MICTDCLEIKWGWIDMTEYRAIYKCRLCGEEFEDGRTSRKNAQIITFMLGFAPNYKHEKLNLYGYRNICHFCKGGSYGMADFLGFRKVEDRNESD